MSDIIGTARIEHWTYVHQDAGVGVGVGTWQGDLVTAGGLTCLRAADGQLDAGGIKLCSTRGHGILERDDFRAKEVVAWSKVAGDSDRRWGPRL